VSDWQQWVADKATLLPGQSLLNPDGNLPGLDNDELKQVAVPFGLVGRMVKEGQSVAIGLNTFSQKDRCHLAYFLHSLHLEACQGLVSGKWVGLVRSSQTRHLMIWGPNREWDVCLQKARSQLHPLHLKKVTKEILKQDPDSLRTMLISRRSRTDKAMEELVSILTPFCIVIDATPWGFKKDFSVDWNTLSRYFPNIPKVVIFNRGDLAMRQELSAQSVHQIIWRHLDDKANHNRALPKPNLLVSPDPVMDYFIGSSLHDLMSAMQRNRNEDIEIFRLGRALLGQLADMVSPYSVYQKTLMSQTGAVTYMQKTPATRLDMLSNAKAQYGAGSALKDDLVSNMQQLLKKLEQGEQGKVALVREFIEKSVRGNESVLVITRTANDADALMKYIIDTSNSVNYLTENFQCVGVNKRWPVSSWNVPFDHILITCTLWYSDLWLLELPNTKISWVCYPHEVPMRQAVYETLYKKSLAHSRPDGDKLKLIRYQWKKNAYLQDWQTSFNEMPICEQHDITSCRGNYVIERDDVRARFSWDSDAVFDRMLEFEVPDQDTVSFESIELTKDLTVISWEEDDKPLVVTPRTKLKVIVEKDDELSDVYCFDLEPGDQVVMMLQDNHAVTDIFNAISDQLSTDMTLALMLRKIAKWHQLIDLLQEKYSVRDIRSGLAKHGVAISENQIRNWLNHRGHGPQQAEKIKAVAALCDDASTRKNGDAIFMAMEEYRKWRRALGKFVKATINEGYARSNIDIEGIKLSSEAIEELLLVRTVREVISPPPAWSEKAGKRLHELIPKIESELGDVIELTPRCKTSMKASPFTNIDIAYRLFELMHSELYRVYTKQNRLESAIEALEVCSIFYRGDTSDSTIGKFANDYQVTYGNKKYNAGKHLVIGNSRDPKYILRVYFDWDEELEKIIIFHAGRHLPTRTG
jgi:hypothetical protein